MTILITGAAGFIGFHLTRRLLADGHTIIGIDNLNDYYAVSLKEDRLALLENSNFIFKKISLEERSQVEGLFTKYQPTIVINLAAQAGVRYSLENPHAYIDANIVGFMNILESCRQHKVKHLIYASSSSVYGANKIVPFTEGDQVDHPISLYAATKKANELMAHTYSHLYGLPTTGLRFFTVYGPWGRPDMAYFSFTRNIVEGKTIKVFNHGQMKRDFTYIDDIMEGIQRLVNAQPPQAAQDRSAYQIFNIGHNKPVPLLDFVRILEDLIGRKAEIEYLPLQPGDLIETYADITGLQQAVGYTPSTPIESGLKEFVEWYMSYYKVCKK